MSVIHGTALGGAVDVGDIPASLRFRGGNVSNLTRTFGTPTSTTKCLISVFYEPGRISGSLVNATLIGRSGTVENAIHIAGTGAFGASVQDRVVLRTGGANKDYWTPVLRDPTAFVWLLISFDTSQATQANRAKLWINGVEAPKGASSLTLNEAIPWNVASQVHTIGSNVSSSYDSDGYFSRYAFLDGKCIQDGSAALSDFAYFNTEINEWVSKAQSAVKTVVDAGGTNSFMLDFDDATSLTTLGYDKSSKGNNWTLNNFSLTAGTTYDRVLDVPGNSFCTLNPLKKNPTLIALSDGNLIATNSGDASVLGTLGMSSGKWYWEVTLTNNGTNGVVGISADDATLSQEVGGAGSSWGYIGATGNKYSAASGSAYGATYTTNDVIGVAYDVSTGTLTFYKNGVSQGAAFSGLSSTVTMFPAVGNSNTTYACNFGQAPLHASATYHAAAGGYFRYAPPSGFKALCQRNLSAAAIKNPENHFDVLLDTGNGSTKSVSGAAFRPGMVWRKGRAAATFNNHTLFDTIRGATKLLQPNQTAAEGTTPNSLTSFDSGGFSLGSFEDCNTNGVTYASWLWKTPTSGSSNTSGSITSQVAANVEAGFSIVTYTGTGANATVGHGLGKAPGLVIIKRRDAAVEWIVGHKNLTSGAYYLNLNTTNAQASNATVFNSTFPASTVFSVGANSTVNNNTNTYVAYCFAEIDGFSKIGSYVGNGSADGPFVHCGFKPKYILLKRIDSADSWIIYDAARDTYNVAANRLLAESSASEAAVTRFDFTATGFKIRASDAACNASGGTYIFYAVADVPSKYSLGR